MTADASHYISGNHIEGAGPELISTDPATGQTIWIGRAATAEEVDHAITAANNARTDWACTDPDQRVRIIESFTQLLDTDRSNLAQLISRETGKPRWESLGEVAAMIAQATLTASALGERRSDRCPITATDGRGVIRYRPVGTLAVFSPYNFPGQVANSQVMPALMAGNTVVLKPSQFTPATGLLIAELWERAGLPPGVLNVVNGGAETGKAITSHRGIDGVFFTGSYKTGRAIAQAVADRPHLMVSMEMGGNNALVVDQVGDANAAAYTTIRSAFASGGQRCSCARRLIVPDSDSNERFLVRLVEMMGSVRVGAWDEEPQPYFGPLVHEAAAQRVLEKQRKLVDAGGTVVVEARRSDRGACFVSPGLVDVTGVGGVADEEVFGPLLQFVRVKDFDSAIDEVNRSGYGMAAGLLCDNGQKWEHFVHEVRAGVVNWNRAMTGMSGSLPFGGIGMSGNHRPGGAFVVDCVTDPVASLESEWLRMPGTIEPGIDL